MSRWSQYFPPRPSFTEANIGSQVGKVILVTGGASGVGFELASLLYSAGAKVYIAGRSERNGHEAIERIQQNYASQNAPAQQQGTLSFLWLDLSDFNTITPAARTFLQQESRLDVLYNNAGVGATFNGETAAQGLPVQLATNCVGHQLLTQLLQPALEQAAASRVIWCGSAVVDFSAIKGGMAVADFEQPGTNGVYNYTTSKVGNWFLASEFARRETVRCESASSGAVTSSQPILHVAVNPGNLRTNVWRSFPRIFIAILNFTMLYEARYGAYCMLWAGLSPELSSQADNGSYVVPWGRKHPCPRADLLDALKSPEEGGSGRAAQFYAWCEKQAADYR